MVQQNQNIAGLQTSAQTGAQAAQNRFMGEGGVLPTFQGDLAKRLEAARTAAEAQGKASVASLGDFSKFNPDVINTLGITPKEADRLKAGKGILDQYGNTVDVVTEQPFYNLGSFNLKNYATQLSPDTEIRPENFASQADYAKAAALSQLTGQDLTRFLNPENATQAGTYNPDLVNFDKEAAMKYVGDTIKDQDTQLVEASHTIDVSRPSTYMDSYTGRIKNAEYYDNVLNGRLVPYNNPNHPFAIRGMMIIQALMRLGLYKPILDNPDNPLVKPF